MIDFLVNAAGVLTFLFIFWKRLKEDYFSQIIFSSAFYILLFGFLTSFLLSRFAPTWFFWGFLIGTFIGSFLAAFRFKLKLNEITDVLVVSLLPLLSFIFLEDSVNNSSLVSFISFAVTLALIFIYFLLSENYRKFAWYKSGKIGFASLSTLTIFFLTRSGVAIFFHDVLSFVGKSEVYLSGGLALISFIALVLLGRQK